MHTGPHARHVPAGISPRNIDNEVYYLVQLVAFSHFITLFLGRRFTMAADFGEHLRLGIIQTRLRMRKHAGPWCHEGDLVLVAILLILLYNNVSAKTKGFLALCLTLFSNEVEIFSMARPVFVHCGPLRWLLRGGHDRAIDMLALLESGASWFDLPTIYRTMQKTLSQQHGVPGLTDAASNTFDPDTRAFVP